MQNFEQIRGHVLAQYRVTTNEPYVLCIELSLGGGKRQQSVFLAELEDDDGRPDSALWQCPPKTPNWLV